MNELCFGIYTFGYLDLGPGCLAKDGLQRHDASSGGPLALFP